MYKKKKCDFYRILLCYNYFSSFAIRITNIIQSIIGIIIIIYGLSEIPFHIDSRIYKYCFILNIFYFIIIILINIIFFIFRLLDLINDRLNLCAFILSIVEIYTSSFALISNFINGFLILDNIKMYQQLAKIKNNKKKPLLADTQILFTKIIIIIISVLWINSILLSFSDCLLIDLQINDSYANYKLSKKIEEKYIINTKGNNKIKRPKKPNIKPKKDDKNKNNKNNSNKNSNNEEEENNNKNIKESIIKLEDGKDHLDKVLKQYEENK